MARSMKRSNSLPHSVPPRPPGKFSNGDENEGLVPQRGPAEAEPWWDLDLGRGKKLNSNVLKGVMTNVMLVQTFVQRCWTLSCSSTRGFNY